MTEDMVIKWNWDTLGMFLGAGAISSRRKIPTVLSAIFLAQVKMKSVI